MWKAVAGSWPLGGCHTGPKPPIWPLHTPLVGGPWSPGILPPAIENWLDAIGTAPEKKKIRQPRCNHGQGQRYRELDRTKEKGIQRKIPG